MTVKIAEGFVEVTARTDEAGAEKSAEKAGSTSGERFSRSFGRSSTRGLSRHRNMTVSKFATTGDRAGSVFARRAARAVFTSKATSSAAADSGKRAGSAFTRSVEDTAGKTRPLRGFFSRMRGDSAREGGGIGGRFTKSLTKSVTGGLGALSGTVGKSFASMTRHPYLLVAAVAAAFAALPAIGAAAGTALALAFGGGIATVGIVAAAQADKVKTAFSDLKNHVVSTMKEIAKPLEGTLVSVADDAKSVFDSLAPNLKTAFKDMAPALEDFSSQLMGAFKGGSVIDSATGAFTALLNDLGPKLGPIFKDMGSALNDLFSTIQDNPGIFNGIITGALKLVTGVIRMVDWLSKAYVWINDKLPGGVMTLVSPLGSLLLNLDKTGGKASGLKDKLKTMGEAFKQAWGFIKDGAQAVKDAVLPILEDIQSSLADSNVLAKVQQWWDQIAEIVQLAGEFLGTVMKGIAKALTWVWDNFGGQIKSIFSGLWAAVSGIITGAFEVIKGIFNTFIGVFTGDWKRAWNGIKQVFSGFWTAIKGILLGALEIIKGLLSAALTIIKGIWGAVWGWVSSFFGGIWDWIVAKVVAAKNWVVTSVTALRDRAVEIFTNIRDWVLARVLYLKRRAQLAFHQARLRILKTVMVLRRKATEFFTNIRDWILARVTYLKRRAQLLFHQARLMILKTVFNLRRKAVDIFTTIRDWIVDRAKGLRDRVTGAVATLKDKVIDAFSKAKDGVKKAWNKLEGVAKAPVSFVIDTVYNSGIVGVWNKIADKVKGLGTLDKFSPEGFAKGGITDATSGATFPGFSSKDDQLAKVRSGEGVLVPEAVDSLGPKFVHTANRLKGRAGNLLQGLAPGFDKGGIIGQVSSFASSLKDGFKDGFTKAAKKAMDPLVDTIKSKFGTDGFRGIPTKMVQAWIPKILSHMKPFGQELEGGKGVKAVPKIAEKYIGDFGGSDYNNKFTRAFGMPGQPWCAMFASEVIKEAKAQKAYNNTRSAAVATFNSRMRSVPHSSRRTGDLATYRGNGHINIVKDKNTTIGGNESNRVRKQHGYVNSATAILRPGKYAKGGIVGGNIPRGGFVDFLHQDKRESPHAPLGLQEMREITSAPPWSKGSHDVGGVLPHGTMAVNQSGQAEVVQTLDQLKALLAAGGGTTIILQDGAIRVDASDIQDVQRFVNMLRNLPQTARQFGARTVTR